MSKYKEGLKLIEEGCCNKDNLISLATIATELSTDGKPMPVVRDVDAYYENGAFYVVTYNMSGKMKQIAQNSEVAFSVNGEGISGSGTGTNLGWVLEPENAELRKKLRTVFAAWYDIANNEEDKNCCYLKIQITKAVVMRDHGAVHYIMDVTNGVIIE